MSGELDFYKRYNWCLNLYITVGEAIDHLDNEINKLGRAPNGWQTDEVAHNVFLLACGLLNCADEHLRGPAFKIPGRLPASIGIGANRLIGAFSAGSRFHRSLSGWRKRWLACLNDYLLVFVRQGDADAAELAAASRGLKSLLQQPLPAAFQREILGVPTPFSRLDLTPYDCLSLAQAFVQRSPDRTQRILLLGLRTSGSYFAPLLRAFFEANGYTAVALQTVEPNKGASRRERQGIERWASHGYTALIVDDPPDSNNTMLVASEIVLRCGFTPERIKFLAPTHPAKTEWFEALPEGSVITLAPHRWHKHELLDVDAVERQLKEYFSASGFTRTAVVRIPRADEFLAQQEKDCADERGKRLKRVFEVRLDAADGRRLTRYVLAKSVGWGWLGYHSFIVGSRLGDHVPPIIGLRNGILYSEWLPQTPAEMAPERSDLLSASGCYVAARTCNLRLSGAAASGTGPKRHHNGIHLLARTLSRAYGRLPAEVLMRWGVGRMLCQQSCPCPTLIDGNMRASEWIVGPGGPLKTDYEHHGLGKAALNICDPAYDLADTILNLSLTEQEERALLARYVTESGDAAVGKRLFLHKILAGIWAMKQAQEQLVHARGGADILREHHRRFMNAWNFLTVHTARHCGSMCHPRHDLGWRPPLVVLDIDDVLDRRMFGFPCATPAALKALSLLCAHNFSVALNTARSAPEVKDYCVAYGMSGGIAEHGSYMWDTVRQRGRVLIGPEAARQLELLREGLQRIPGVFLDDRHQYSIRAFTYQDTAGNGARPLLGAGRPSAIGDGALAPITTHIVRHLLTELRLDRLTFHHTSIDTTIVAKEVDKGTGLIALRDTVLGHDAATIAIGDGEADLPMFRAASRSFAPANIGPRRQAKLLGCRVASRRDQQGLLEIVRSIMKLDHENCERCREAEMFPHDTGDPFLSVLRAADRRWTANLARALLHRSAYKSFIR